MTEKIAVAIMGCSQKENQKIINLGSKVKINFYGNVAIYPAPPVTEEAFSAQLLLASDAQSLVSKGSVIDTADRDTQVGKLWVMLYDNILFYVNNLFRGNRQNLLLAGYDVSYEMIPHPIPAAPLIDRIVNGNVIHSAKIYLTKASGLVNGKSERLTYCVWVQKIGVLNAVYENLVTTTSRFKLVVPGLTRGQDHNIYITARNAAGLSLPSIVGQFMAS